LLLLLLPVGSSQTHSSGLQATVAAVAVAVAVDVAVVVAAAAAVVVDHSTTDDTASADGTSQRSAAAPSYPAVSAASSPADNLQAA